MNGSSSLKVCLNQNFLQMCEMNSMGSTLCIAVILIIIKIDCNNILESSGCDSLKWYRKRDIDFHCGLYNIQLSSCVIYSQLQSYVDDSSTGFKDIAFYKTYGDNKEMFKNLPSDRPWYLQYIHRSIGGYQETMKLILTIKDANCMDSAFYRCQITYECKEENRTHLAIALFLAVGDNCQKTSFYLNSSGVYSEEIYVNFKVPFVFGPINITQTFEDSITDSIYLICTFDGTINLIPKWVLLCGQSEEKILTQEENEIVHMPPVKSKESKDCIIYLYKSILKIVLTQNLDGCDYVCFGFDGIVDLKYVKYTLNITDFDILSSQTSREFSNVRLVAGSTLFVLLFTIKKYSS
ncbi:hypothetical protein Btru_024977 [Bulinus truncatus]|nr:hypothetical protein Btru_024977 [Bulinus truncatus]